MNRITNISGLRVATLPDTEEGMKELGAKLALYQSGVFQAALSGLNTSVPAVTPGENSLPNLGNMPDYGQQNPDTSGGTTSLADIMTYLGVAVSPADINHDIQRTQYGLAPEDMINFARDHGLQADEYNNGTWDEVKSQIDAGHPVQAMIDGGSFIVITGYGKDPVTGEEYVKYNDPKQDTEQQMSLSDFEKKWSNTGKPLQVVPSGYKNYFIAYGDGNSKLPPGNNDGIQGIQAAENGGANYWNGLDRIFDRDSWGGVAHGVFQVVGSAPQAVFGYFGAELQLGAQYLNDKVKGIPVLRNFVEPLGDAVNGIGAGIGDLANGAGESVNDIGTAIEQLSHGDFKGAAKSFYDSGKDAVTGVYDAGKDVVSSVKNAVEDLFDW